jgi:cell division septation protein DedD
MTGRTSRNWVLLGSAILMLSACAEGGPFAANQGDATDGANSTRIVERDVEAPSVFSVLEPALWDGRPSLGGVWVAHPTALDPERVIIRNPANGKFVIGALFRRERENPGPKLQASSDAATALGLLAGQPTELSVIALRREEVSETLEPPAQPILDTSEQIATESLDPPTGAPTPAAAGSAVATAPIAQPALSAAAVAASAETPRPQPKPAAPAAAPASGGRNLLQIGIFSIEANAKRAADQLKSVGASSTIKKESSQGKTFWRVLAGPAGSAAEREALKKKVTGLGYGDAYFVSR